MSTFRELTYIVLDELKSMSDDTLFNEEHVMFLLKHYRGMLLKQYYKDIKKDIPASNFQTLCLNLEEVSSIPGERCIGDTYLKTKEVVPDLMEIASPQVYPIDYYNSDIAFVSRERMRYTGHNRWLKNIIYASIGPDNHIYLKSNNPQFLYLEKLKITGVFEDPEKASELECDNNDESSCDPMDRKFPLEEALIPQLTATVVKELSGVRYIPEDNINNASDDASNIMQYLRKNLKSATQKQIEGNE